MIINTPVSIGELVDKISILKIKKDNIKEEKKLKLIKDELQLLEKELSKIAINDPSIEKYLQKLVLTNSKLWKIEDNLRECERKKIFNQDFIELARSVYFTNDERSRIKLEINNNFGSKIVEVKSYKEY